jgi:hypothetical protein
MLHGKQNFKYKNCLYRYGRKVYDVLVKVECSGVTFWKGTEKLKGYLNLGKVTIQETSSRNYWFCMYHRFVRTINL